jgi:hypothetical protein
LSDLEKLQCDLLVLQKFGVYGGTIYPICPATVRMFIVSNLFHFADAVIHYNRFVDLLG